MTVKFTKRREMIQRKKTEKQQKKMEKEAGTDVEKKRVPVSEKLEPLRGLWQTFGIKMGEIHFLVEEEDKTVSFLKKTPETPDSERKIIEVTHLSEKEFEATWKIGADHSVTTHSVLNNTDAFDENFQSTIKFFINSVFILIV